jgi:hypothetical protein
MGWVVGGSNPIRGKKVFSFFQNIQTRSGGHPAFYSLGAGVLSPVAGVEVGGERKRPGREIDHSPPASAKVNHD